MTRRRLHIGFAVFALSTGVVPAGAGEWRVVESPGLERVRIDSGVVVPRLGQLRLEPVRVEFAKGWQPRRAGSHLPLRESDYRELSADLARAVREGFAETFAEDDADSGWRLRLRLHDTYVSAPDTWEAQRMVTYTQSVGSARLEAELIDPNGAVRAQISDWRAARGLGGPWLRTDRLHNRVEFERLADEWARALAQTFGASSG